MSSKGLAELAAEGARQVGPAGAGAAHAVGRVEGETDQRLAARIAQPAGPATVSMPGQMRTTAIRSLVRQAGVPAWRCNHQSRSSAHHFDAR